MAERVSRDPWFLGWAISAYKRRFALDDVALARELGADDPAIVVVLRMCRRPTLEEDIAEIARRFAVNPAALARIVSETNAAR
jgi:hypothetical protein